MRTNPWTLGQGCQLLAFDQQNMDHVDHFVVPDVDHLQKCGLLVSLRVCIYRTIFSDGKRSFLEIKPSDYKLLNELHFPEKYGILDAFLRFKLFSGRFGDCFEEFDRQYQLVRGNPARTD